MKHLLKLLDLSKEEITELLDLADRLRRKPKPAWSTTSSKAKRWA